MKPTTMFLAAAATCAPALPGLAQNNGDKPIPAVPPPTAHSSTGTTNAMTQNAPHHVGSGAKEGLAHNTGNVANGPTPPRTTGTPPGMVPNRPGTMSSGQQTTQVNPHNGAGYQHGDANVGNSSEPNGVLGSTGASASATMQNGQPNRH